MMRDFAKRAGFTALLALLATALPLACQSADQWRQDVDALVSLIETHHPKPWAKISREEFMRHKEKIQGDLHAWSGERIAVELMRLVSGLRDGHTEVLLSSQAGFNLWFPVRMEVFADGTFVTAVDEAHPELLAARVLKLGALQAAEACARVADIAPKDSDLAAAKPVANFLANAVILKALGIIDDEKEMRLEVVDAGGARRMVSLSSAPWRLSNNWTWNKTVAPTANKVRTVYDGHLGELPPYLAKMIPRRIPYWFEFFPEKKLLFLQCNAVTDWSRDPFAEFTQKVFKAFDENRKDIERFVIDLRFNEGGNGYLLRPFVQEFILRREALPRGMLYIITGRHTFSAAPNLIGQMLKQTRAITVGDVAPGPLNWYSDVLSFTLPNSGLVAQISTMFWMEGHAMDQRGYYPPDVYVPQTFAGLVSWKDQPLEVILSGQALPLKDILVEQGWDHFKTEFERRKALHPDVMSWFPYTHFDLVLAAYFDLLQAKKADDALALMRFTSQLYPHDLRSWYGLAEVAKDLDDIDLALDAYEKVSAMEPQLAEIKSAYLSMRLRKSFRDQGTKGLTAMFAELKAAHPGVINENSLNLMGYNFLQKGKTAEALSIFKLNLNFYPAYANGYDSLAEAYIQAKDRKNATRAYQKALALDPNMRSAKEALAKLLGGK